MLRSLVRPLLSLIVLAALVVALLQAGGRLVFALLDKLEVPANQLLAGRQIRVSGLEGDWHGFNPVIRVARVELPAGHIESVYLELNLLQTLLQSRYVLFRARVGSAALTLEKPEGANWHLAGFPPGTTRFDPLPLLTGSDQLEFDGVLAFRRAEYPVSSFRVHYRATNRDGRGRHRLRLRNGPDDCAAPCVLLAEFQQREGRWPISPAKTALRVSATRLVLPGALLGKMPAQVEALELDWHDAMAKSGGTMVLAVADLPDAGQPLVEVRIGAVVRGAEGRHWGEIGRFEVVHDARSWSLHDLRFGVRDGRLEAAIPDLPVTEVTAVLRSLLANNDVVSRWLDALALDSELRNVRAFLEPSTGLYGYGADVAKLAMNDYRGVPWIRGAAGTLHGYGRLVPGRPLAEIGQVLEMQVASDAAEIAFPDQLHGRWAVNDAAGQLQAWFRRDQLGLRGLDMTVRTGATTIEGGFSVSRRGPEDVDRRLAALVRLDRIDVADARRFVPYVLQPGLYQWLTETPAVGVVSDARVAYQGQFRVPPGELGRRLEIAGQVTDGGIRFHPDWPAVEAFSGPVRLAGSETHVLATRARSLGAELAGTRLHLTGNGAQADVDLVAALDAGAALGLVRASPLADWLPIIAPDWSGDGPLELTGKLILPLREFARRNAADGARPASAPEGLAVELEATLDGVGLDMPGFGLAFGALRGPVRYEYPGVIDSAGLDGTLFDAPMRATVTNVDDRIRLHVAGRARASDIWKVAGFDYPGFGTGAAQFDATLDVAAPARAPVQDAVDPPLLQVRSTLEGLTLDLPAGYAKTADAIAPMEFEVSFGRELRRIALAYADASGWMTFSDRPEQGAIGFGTAPGVPAAGERVVLIEGRIARLAADELLPPGDGARGAVDLPLPVRLAGLEIDSLGVGAFDIVNARLEGDISRDGFHLRMVSDNVTGMARRWIDRDRPGAETIDLIVDEIRLPAPSGERAPPLPVALIERSPDTDVVIERLLVGDQDYGRWRFEMRREGADLWLHGLEARLRGVDVIGTDGLVWRGAADETTFTGTLRMVDLADVLPQWGYAANVDAERAELTGTFRWPGSPISFAMLEVIGTAQARAENGRFLDVESGGGAQRILSLLNFTTFAKRISLDFSDVIGRGVSFDRLKAGFTLDRGRLDLTDALDVEGTGLRLRITGAIDLDDRVLDHEMIVTLPVSRGLPWYAAYVALANPIAGIGVLVGERVLRKPLEQFSSAKYRITGTVENPEVRLVSVFDTSATERPVDPAILESQEDTAAPPDAAAPEQQQVIDE